MPNIDLDILQFLSHLHKTRSMSLTAKSLKISASTASRILHNARELFEDPLFTRSAQMMYPTLRMDELIPHIERLIGEFNALLTRERFQVEKIERCFRIAALDCATSLILAPAILRARETAPKVQFHVVPISNNSFEDLRQGLVDLVLFGTDALPVNENIFAHPLVRTGYHLVMSAGHPLATLAAERALTQADIESWDLVSIESPFSRLNPTVALPWFDKTEQTGAIVMPYHFCAALLARGSDLIVELAAPMAKQMVEDVPGLTSVPITNLVGLEWTPTVYWHERTQFDPALQWFRGLLEVCAKTLDA